MRTPRFSVEAIRDEVLLEKKDSRHARDVLRLGPGSKVVLFDGTGREAVCEVVSIDRGVRLRKISERRIDRELSVECVAAVSPPKGDRLAFLVRKLTELGAARFVPLACERSVVPAGPAKAARLEKIAREAAKQCGRNVLPEIAPEATPERLLAREAGARVFYGAPDAPRTFLAALEGLDARRIVCCVGPEGGFSPGETGLLERAGATPVLLGPAILRVETAAIAFQSVLAQRYAPPIESAP